jgi:Asp-tRNA(Asn)/Glu-tRNA(Gln) amidotransferase A subunit family amidase
MLSTEGAKPFSPSLDTIGWFTQNAHDLGIILDIFAAGAREISAMRDLKIALWLTPAWASADQDTHDAMTKCSDLLTKGGARVEYLSVPPSFDSLAEDHLTIMFGEGMRSFAREAKLGPDRIGPAILDIARNTRNITPQMMRNAMDRAAECRHIYDVLTSQYDAVISPSTIGAAPAGLDQTGSLIFNGLLTLLHVPAINMPVHRARNGMPVGLTLSGARYSDHKLLSVAESISTITKSQA